MRAKDVERAKKPTLPKDLKRLVKKRLMDKRRTGKKGRRGRR